MGVRKMWFPGSDPKFLHRMEVLRPTLSSNQAAFTPIYTYGSSGYYLGFDGEVKLKPQGRSSTSLAVIRFQKFSNRAHYSVGSQFLEIHSVLVLCFSPHILEKADKYANPGFGKAWPEIYPLDQLVESPQKEGGTEHLGTSCVSTLLQMQKLETKANASVIYVPPPFAGAAIMEAMAS
nr:succinate--CoA ligase [ADP-forming] subunit alpha, mitochondrial [Ipomoea batatas]